jgi:hypothetical protein
MEKVPKDEAREERIMMEVVVDAYDREEQAMGWYYYLEEALGDAEEPILARCIAERAISPLQVGDEVEILGMAPAEECDCEMFVMIRWGRRGEKQGLGVPLSQLQLVHADEAAQQAAGYWHYWVGRGYRF